MYIYYVKKDKGKHTPGISALISWYIKNLQKNTFIFCYPGYLSTGTRCSAELKQIMSLFTNLNNNHVKINGLFSYSMNFNNQSLFYSKLKSNFAFLDNIRPGGDLRDHSKSMWFYQFDDSDPNISRLFQTSKLEQALIDGHEISLPSSNLKAVALGSTNVSATSYFRNPPDKGESDVFS